jgi:hypothetical protein
MALILIAPSTASAFVCTRATDGEGNETGPSLSWFFRDGGRTLWFAVQQDGTEDITSSNEFNDLKESFQVWQNLEMEDSMGCDLGAGTDLEFYGLDSPVGFQADVFTSSDRTGYDYLEPAMNENLLVFRDQGWPHAGQGTLIIALTTLTYNSLTGEILDSDIEYNSEKFSFTDKTSLNNNTDLMNTTVHELGHFLGLGHTADADDTMFPRADTGEIKKRSLACNDAKGIVFKYPANAVSNSDLPRGAERNGYCNPPNADCGYCALPQELTRIPTVEVVSTNDGSLEDEGGCQSTSVAPLWMLLVGFLMLTLKRRRVL